MKVSSPNFTVIRIIALIITLLPLLVYSSSKIIISTSNGIYSVDNQSITGPIIQKKTSAGKQLDAFKTVRLENGKWLVAWGMGRTIIDKKRGLASLELLSGKSFRQRETLIDTRGKRLRDVVADGDNIVAVGHEYGDIHLYALRTKKHSVIQLRIYQDGIIHAVEKADLDHDGINEFYITLTSANRGGGLGQAGRLLRVDVNWDTLSIKTSTVLDAYNEYASYIKEIALADINGDGENELIVEVAPQIEAYSKTDLNYTEPMRLLSLGFRKGVYEVVPLASADIRLGRLLSFDDIDQDGKTEIYFADYYQTGIYVLESKDHKFKASGEKLNLLSNNWTLTRIKVVSAQSGSKLLKLPLNLRSNQIIYLKDSKQLLAVSDSRKNPQSGTEKYMSIHYFSVRQAGNTYYLEYNQIVAFDQPGSLWQMTKILNRQ